MKKIIVLILSLVMILLTFSSCTENNTSSVETSSTETFSTETSSNNTSSSVEYLSDDMLASIVARKLQITDTSRFTYMVSELLYWQEGGRYYKNIEFYEKNVLVASAGVDPNNGTLLKQVYEYIDYGLSDEDVAVAEVNFYTFFKDRNVARYVAFAMGKAPHDAITEQELASYSGEITIFINAESLEGIGYLKSITELDVCKNDVSEIPSEISECKNLKRLDLLKAYCLAKLPENIGELENLEFLRVSLTNVDELPESIGNLKKLKYLYFDNCDITTVPKSIGGCESLVVLDLHSNDITEVPDSITNLKNLKSLDLGYTKITSLPENIGELTEMIRLDLFGLDIRQLPQSMKNMTKLEFLNVYNNYNLNEDYKQWFPNECYKCTTDPSNDPDWDDGYN